MPDYMLRLTAEIMPDDAKKIGDAQTQMSQGFSFSSPGDNLVVFEMLADLLRDISQNAPNRIALMRYLRSRGLIESMCYPEDWEPSAADNERRETLDDYFLSGLPDALRAAAARPETFDLPLLFRRAAWRIESLQKAQQP
jgi:hypothetical protein